MLKLCFDVEYSSDRVKLCFNAMRGRTKAEKRLRKDDDELLIIFRSFSE